MNAGNVMQWGGSIICVALYACCCHENKKQLHIVHSLSSKYTFTNSHNVILSPVTFSIGSPDYPGRAVPS